ncbi:hypothetical protein [Nonomuraea sp. NPDC049750]|uniref:hypothetical protein n=1 Tax=Nonomuraea sp. NPDC049750 TaxID=3154738 RepID=UPI0033C02303
MRPWLPSSQTKRAELARAYGADDYALVEPVYAPFSDPPAVCRRNLRDHDRLHLEVIGDGVGARVARTQLDGQALAGVVAPGGQREQAEAALERPGRASLSL